MPLFVTTRRAFTSVLAALLMPVLCLPAVAQQPNAGPRAATPRAMPPHPGFPGHYGANQEHLLQWMDHHSNLTPDQQQKALSHEPGFRDLPPETQQRMHERLNQLNSMPPERRRRWLERNEAIARLTPPQRQQVRDAMRQFGSLPTDRRHQVARAFRELRDTPESQRQALLNSDRYRSQFSDEEFGALSGLLSIEPYHVIMPNRQVEDSPGP
jgi:Spy/CpxP family protein refolding chaperone